MKRKACRSSEVAGARCHLHTLQFLASRAISSRLSAHLSFLRMLSQCAAAVLILIPRVSDIFAMEYPKETSSAICSSRLVSCETSGCKAAKCGLAYPTGPQ